MVLCLIALGSNLGDRAAFLNGACEALARSPDIRDLRRGETIETPAIGGKSGQAEFLNSSLTIETELEPVALARLLQSVEKQLGRAKSDRWDERVIDLDLIIYGDVRRRSVDLTLPHPRFAFRRFVLESAARLVPTMIDPVTQLTMQQLLTRLDKRPHWIAVAGAEVSNAWINDTAAAASAGVDAASPFWPQRRLTPGWDASAGAPTLLIVVETRPGSAQDITERAESLHVPWLGMDAADENWAAREIVAAFDAMA